MRFDFNPLTNKFEAELTFLTTLTAGTFQLTALANIQDLAGNSLDGDQDGKPGGNQTCSFAIANVLASGSEFQVNTTTISVQREPDVAMDADGNYVVVWESNEQDGSSFGIFAQRYNAAGVAQGPEFKSTRSATAINFLPRLQ